MAVTSRGDSEGWIWDLFCIRGDGGPDGGPGAVELWTRALPTRSPGRVSTKSTAQAERWGGDLSAEVPKQHLGDAGRLGLVQHLDHRHVDAVDAAGHVGHRRAGHLES